MFDSLQQSLAGALKTLTGKGKLTEANMRDGLALVQQALLEADVSYSVVKDFMARVTTEAVGEKVLGALKPSEQLVGVVHQQLLELMGPVDSSLHLKPDLTVLMMCGLQGSGKTTTCGKLARLIKERGRTPLMVAADLQRPAAIHQLHVIGEQLGVPVYSEAGATDPVGVCQRAVQQAKKSGAQVVILDTAGRLHIDDELMSQLRQIDAKVGPDQAYLVVDGMTGQDAVNSAKAFNEALELDGVILTKLDGDARGGAVLSVKAVTGVPIKFIGTGEHLDALQEFHPDRMAQRILGMGDVLTLVEQAQQKFDADEMAQAEEEMRKGEFTLETFAKMLKQTRRLGPLGNVLKMIPGMGGMADALGGHDAEGEMQQLLGIVDSMTPTERRQPSKLIDTSRRRRIASGAGVEPHQVSELVKQFDTMAAMMKEMSSLGMRERMKRVQALQQGLASGGTLTKNKVGTGKRLTGAERAKLKKDREKEARRRKRDQRGR